ncbi:camphor resistance protein CrcB [Gracilibacillus ureilyticus]|uniref:Fluoride-specific ion channel FluC n=1 Tax=Gracilibacillus ureilyticus TaxID=531814 RepID=A0A1H9NCP5_9BACI|nr:fluoride efflux transporter CrcB [Gracilibacillus ureilyticus]SER33668.1 camphor resistance protein CrcB [Gracilibacillus ureilyticus]
MTLTSVLLVGTGGFFGAISRYAISQIINKKNTSRIPIATVIVNLTGSFLLGIIIGVGLNNMITLLLGTGFMGAFTTFSTFKLEAVHLHINKRKREFIYSQLICYAGGISLAFIGMMIGNYFS